MFRQRRLLTTSDFVVPPELGDKVSPPLVEFAQARIGVWAFGMVLATMFGTPAVPIQFVDPSFLKASLYLAAPCISPFILAAVLSVIRLHPYRGMMWVTKVRPVDMTDPVAVRLAELYKSEGVRRYLWQQAAKFSLILLGLIAVHQIAIQNVHVLALLFPARPSTPKGWVGEFQNAFGPSILMVSIAAFLVLGCEVHAWCLRTWVAQETKSRGTQRR
jgi:hypothetical protein